MSETFVERTATQATRRSHASIGVLRLGRATSATARDAIGAALGQALPLAPNRAAGAAPRVLWTAPDEWVVLDASPAQLDALATACAGELWHYADLTDGVAAFRLAGPRAAELLAAECPLELSDVALPPDHCAQSLFADIAILVDRRPGEAGLHVFVDASLAGHLAAWFRALGALGGRG
jgi:heterotetrameric sarcosine oxidase gamma subunit